MEQVEKYNESEMKLIGMTFMGFLMGVAALCGIWFLAGVLQMLPKLLG